MSEVKKQVRKKLLTPFWSLCWELNHSSNFIDNIMSDCFSFLFVPESVIFRIGIDPRPDRALAGHKAAPRVNYYCLINFFYLFVSSKQRL